MKCVGCLFGGEKPIVEVPPDSTPRNRIFSRDYIQCRHCKLRRPPANPRFSIYAAGWLLLSAYRRIGTGLEFNSSENDNSLDFDLVFSFTLYCRLESPQGEAIFAEGKHTVSGWRKLAAKYGIPKSEQDVMVRAFMY